MSYYTHVLICAKQQKKQQSILKKLSVLPSFILMEAKAARLLRTILSRLVARGVITKITPNLYAVAGKEPNSEVEDYLP